MTSDLVDTAYNAFGEAFSDVIRAALTGALVAWVFFMGFFGAGLVRSKIRILYVMAACVPVAAGFGWLMSQNLKSGEATPQSFLMFFYALIPLWSGCLWRAWTRWTDEKGDTV